MPVRWVEATAKLGGRVPYKEEIAVHFRGVPWKELNTQYKNKYSEALDSILSNLENEGIDPAEILAEINSIHSMLEDLAITRGKRPRPPK